MQMQSKQCKADDDDDGGGGGISLPEDIILEVLLRLPAKSLRRFRCVCMAWRALIDAPAFLAAQRSRATGPFMVAVFGSSPGRELRLMDKGGNVLRVFDLGTPALLALTRLDHIFVDRMEHGAMVIDPASGHDFTIVGTADPPPQHPWDTSSWTIVNDYNFGRAVPSGDYKVFRLHVIESWGLFGRSLGHRCEVGTIMDDGSELTWRPRPWCPFYQPCSFSWEHKTAVNGDLYYFMASHGRIGIATFNIEREEWKPNTIEGPPFGQKKVNKWHIAITELKGTLCMVENVQYLADLGLQYANIWLLKDPDTSVWVMEYKIQMPERLLLTKPLDVLIDGTLVMLNWFAAGNNEKCHQYILQFYNSSTKAFTDFMEMADGFNGTMAFYTGNLQS